MFLVILNYKVSDMSVASFLGFIILQIEKIFFITGKTVSCIYFIEYLLKCLS